MKFYIYFSFSTVILFLIIFFIQLLQIDEEWPSPEGNPCKSYRCVTDQMGEATRLEKTTICDKTCPDVRRLLLTCSFNYYHEKFPSVCFICKFCSKNSCNSQVFQNNKFIIKLATHSGFARMPFAV